MKIYPKLDQFLTNLAYCAMTEDGLIDICDAAGIDWRWPKCFAGEVVSEYLDLRKEIGADRARDKMRSTTRMLEGSIMNLAGLPNELDGLRIEYRDLIRIQPSTRLMRC